MDLTSSKYFYIFRIDSTLGLFTCFIMSAVEGASPRQMLTIDHQKTQGPTAQLEKVDSWATGPSISFTKLTSLQASHVQCCSIDPFDEGSNLGEDVMDLALSRSKYVHVFLGAFSVSK